MLGDLAQVIGVDRVEHIEKVVAVGQLVVRHLGGEVNVELRVVLQRWPELLDRELIILWDLDGLHLLLLQQLLIVGEHELEEIFVHHLRRRQIVLNWREMSKMKKMTYDAGPDTG